MFLFKIMLLLIFFQSNLAMAAIFNQFFGSFEEPPFTLIKKYDDGLEEREYTAFHWVCTKRTPEDSGSLGENGMFKRLFNYISGENESKSKIAMTAPVSTWVSLTTDGKEEFREMAFFLGKDQQQKLLKPTNDKVYIRERPGVTVFTRIIGGYVEDQMWIKEAEHLKTMIKNNSLDVEIDENGYFQNGYDSPMKFFNRRNEVWLVKN